jgi:hypothetical protein
MSMTSIHSSTRRFSLLLAATLFCLAGCGGNLPSTASLAHAANNDTMQGGGGDTAVSSVPDATRKGHIDRSHGAIYGTVRNFTAGILANVTVVATSPALCAIGTASLVSISDADGVFAFSDLPPGPYDLAFYYDRATANYSVDVVANTWQPSNIGFATAPRGDTEYFAQWRTPRVGLPEQLSQFRSGSSSFEIDYDLDDCNFGHNLCLKYPATFVDDISFSSNCALGHFPCGPTIARTDYPTFGTSSIVRMNPFASLRQR